MPRKAKQYEKSVIMPDNVPNEANSFKTRLEKTYFFGWVLETVKQVRYNLLYEADWQFTFDLMSKLNDAAIKRNETIDQLIQSANKNTLEETELTISLMEDDNNDNK